MQTQTKQIRFGHSPDPDDAFMFYAFAKETIPMRGFEVTHVIKDIESLNQRALGTVPDEGDCPLDLLEVTAVSCHAYAYLADKYAVMRSGASIGDKYGPILVAKKGTASADIKKKRVAIPGKLTTAFLTIQLYEKDFEAVFTPFDQILDVVQKGEVDFGLVIHEGQITYDQYDLEKVLDLGEWWHEKTGLPLPLGIDVIRKDLGQETMQDFAKLFKESIQYSLDNREPALKYALEYGRGISDELNDRFVGMYVNDRTVDIGPDGEKALQTLLDEGYAQGLIPHKIALEFVG